MSSEVVLRTRNLCKFYNVYDRPSDRLKQMLYRGRRRFYTPVEAVKNVSLEIYRGETFGIVGRNGSGKSTFLQLVCGTLAPSMGELEVRGKVSALLELGAGFNPEFSGRENVFVSGAVMGLTQAEIEERFDRIAAFADIGQFIEQPVKNYSSGMYARLAFAVAINVDAEVLVVDEALAVGDEAFQRKCFARIDALKEQGCTILFVSHGAGTVIELCDRAMLMDQGECLAVGSPRSVIAVYQRMIYAPPEEQQALRAQIVAGELVVQTSEEEDPNTASRAEQPRRIRSRAGMTAMFDPNLVPKSTMEYARRACTISNPRILDHNQRQVNILVPGEQYVYTYEVAFPQRCEGVRFGMMLKLLSGFELGGLISHARGSGMPVVASGSLVRLSFRFRAALNPGPYFLNAGVVGEIDGEEVFLHRIIDAAMFRVQHPEANCVGGIVDFSVEPHCSVEISTDGAGSALC